MIPAAVKAAILAQVRAGANQHAVALEHRVSEATVWKLAHAAGIPSHKYKGGRPAGRPNNPAARAPAFKGATYHPPKALQPWPAGATFAGHNITNRERVALHAGMGRRWAAWLRKQGRGKSHD